MPANALIWVGLICCLTALGIQIFPNAAFQAGVDVGAAWLVFGFGVFLIVIATAIGLARGDAQKR